MIQTIRIPVAHTVRVMQPPISMGERWTGSSSRSSKACKNNFDPACSLNQQQPDVMGYHDAREIPNYWAYAQQFVLQDHMFEPNASWSLPEHLFQVSGWSATCTQHNVPASCTNSLDQTKPWPPTKWTSYPAGSQNT